MTDSQIDHISQLISDSMDFVNSIADKTEFSNNPKLKIKYKEDGTFIIITDSETIQANNSDITGFLNELLQDEKNSINSRNNHNPIFELKELDNGDYLMDEEYYRDMFFARQVSSGYGTYKKKLIVISKIFSSGRSIKYKEEHFLNSEEFTHGLLAKLPDFVSIEDELRK